MTKARRIADIKEEIKWYGVKRKIANVMLRLGNMGFEFSGHGAGMGGEDFGLTMDLSKSKYMHVSISDMGRKGTSYFADVVGTQTMVSHASRTFKNARSLYAWITKHIRIVKQNPIL